MQLINEKFQKDFYRNTKKKMNYFNFLKYLILDYKIRFLFFYRLKNNNFIRKIVMKKMIKNYGLEILNDCGAGLYIGHPHNININPNAKVGVNCNIHKGATIGQENRGKRCGSPTIGNQVWIGINATIVGNIIIGDDVLIAPNSYVNVDVPSHSIVFGNPCIIKHKNQATEKYIENLINKGE